jgi:hypothetical protein
MAVSRVDRELQCPRQGREDQKTVLVNIPNKVLQKIPLGSQWLGSRHGHVRVEVEERIIGDLGRAISGPATAFSISLIP